MSESSKLKLGIVGGGAVSELMHLPTATKLPSVSVYAVVDKNEERVNEMADKFCIARSYTDHKKLFGEVDMVIIALPNHLHAQLSVDFLKQGIHVLCEKPMATTTKECKSMIAAQKESKAKLMIGHNKRFMSNVMFLKKLLDDGSLKDIRDYKCQVGSKFRWPTQSGFYFKKNEAGGGVLIDMGVHIIDTLLWFFGGINDVSYQAQDIMGTGVEDNATITLEHKNAVSGEIVLSRTEVLENELVMNGDSGWAKLNIFDTTSLELNSRNSKVTEDFGALSVKTKNNDSYRDQLIHFVECIQKNKNPLISGNDGMKVIEVVEKCYTQSSD